MLAPAKRTSAPRSLTFMEARNFSRRSLRNRSKSTRICQSAPVWLYTRRGSQECGWPMNLVSIIVEETSFHLFGYKAAHKYKTSRELLLRKSCCAEVGR